MRVLHLDAGKEMRGGQWQVLRLVQGERAAGIEAILLARAGSPLYELVRKAGCDARPLSFARAALLARRSDLVHAHDARSHTIAALTSGTPLIVARRVAFEPAARSSLSEWKYRKPVRFIAVSEFVKTKLVERGVPAGKVAVVYDGVPLLKSAGAAPTRRVLAPANETDPRKGSALALAAARLAGVPLERSRNLEQDLPGAAAFLYITHSEGLGSGALLAMAAGIPVVASNIGGLPEIIADGESGFLVENTPEAIAARLRELLSNPQLARRIGVAGRETVAARFSVESMISRTIEVYRQALS